MWEIGEQLVCIDDSNWNQDAVRILGGILPIKDNIYTYDGKCTHPLGVYLAEFTTISDKGNRVSFHQRRFVKLDDYLMSINISSAIKEDSLASQLVEN